MRGMPSQETSAAFHQGLFCFRKESVHLLAKLFIGHGDAACCEIGLHLAQNVIIAGFFKIGLDHGLGHQLASLRAQAVEFFLAVQDDSRLQFLRARGSHENSPVMRSHVPSPWPMQCRPSTTDRSSPLGPLTAQLSGVLLAAQRMRDRFRGGVHDRSSISALRSARLMSSPYSSVILPPRASSS